MPLKKAAGNMYPWVTHTHSHLAGECPHRCCYCYVSAMAKRFPNLAARASGPVRLMREELNVAYGSGRTIFVEHLNDLFADAVETTDIAEILYHCCNYPGNTYVFQTKNPERVQSWARRMPPNVMLGTTIESNVMFACMGDAPEPLYRADAMEDLSAVLSTFVTVEPILRFLPINLATLITRCKPQFVNIGADSKGTGLPEPSADDVRELIRLLTEAGIEIRQKSNLERLLTQ